MLAAVPKAVPSRPDPPAAPARTSGTGSVVAPVGAAAAE